MLINNSSFRSEMLELAPVTRPVIGSVKVPGSKSITNRALLIAALAEGESTLTGALFSDDTRYMAAALNQLGIRVSSDPAAESFVVSGQGGRIPAEEASLFLGNSGTSMRFLAAAVALGHGRFVLDGVPRMRERPIAPMIAALRDLGVDVVSTEVDGFPPLEVNANGISGSEVTMAGDKSSQYFTGLLIAAPYARDGMTIRVDGELVSTPYIDITADVMAAFGVEAEIDEEYTEFVVPGGQAYHGRIYDIEPDASNASYFFAAAAVTGGEVRIDGLGIDSLQGDLDFVYVLEAMGATVDVRDTQTIVRGPADGRLRGGEFDMTTISDTAQTLAAIAPFADGPVTIRGIAHNRLKETDRVRDVAIELRKLGQQVDEFEDGMTITPSPVVPAEIETYDDHRMAMSFGVTGLRAPGVRILDPGCTAKTFPDYWDRLIALTGTNRLI
ncbi:MAG: 3-phosphoshikimate 1-carboxyvinyltransferase [Thermomicrobiales bacterium]|nr:3-phosphoshikimate 1-carboxyvinyltransferase [Thermomicrobiales bacterium]